MCGGAGNGVLGGRGAGGRRYEGCPEGVGGGIPAQWGCPGEAAARVRAGKGLLRGSGKGGGPEGSCGKWQRRFGLGFGGFWFA